MPSLRICFVDIAKIPLLAIKFALFWLLLAKIAPKITAIIKALIPKALKKFAAKIDIAAKIIKIVAA